MEKYEAALLLFLGFGGTSIILALLYKFIRKHIYQEVESVDRTFDAGGKISTSLTAVTVASQLLWPADVLQSATLTVKVGIAGPIWYTIGVAISIATFPVVSVYLKTRAPGAKTYPQIIFARHGRTAHLVYCFLALLVNVLILAILIVAGTTTIQSVTPSASDEFCLIILATIFGSYSYVGGLGTTFYVSYFNAVLLYVSAMIIVISIIYKPTDSISEIGSLEKIYNAVKNLSTPDVVGNEDNSYLTFHSMEGLVWALVGLFVTAALTFCDQASWQSRIAAKPLQGVLGFQIASFMWVVIPASVAATTGMGYLAVSATNLSEALTSQQIDEGLVTPYIANLALGKTGDFLVLTMVGMALMSTGSGEVMAVSSIIVYDIYQTHIYPYRKVPSTLYCILCGLRKKEIDITPKDEESFCQCPDASSCSHCQETKDEDSFGLKKSSLCPHHGKFRMYHDMLLRYKSWCILWVAVGIIPYGMLVISSGIDLNWAYMAGAILTIPGLPGLILSIFWCKSTPHGVIIGSITGLVAGIAVWFGVGNSYEDGLANFVKNTSQPFAILGGGLACMLTSLIVTVFVSLFTHKIKTSRDEKMEWRKLRNIDNPLLPWADLYREDFPHLENTEKPSHTQLEQSFKKAKYLSFIGGGIIAFLLVLLIPGVMATLHVLSFEQFSTWTKTIHIWGVVMAFLVFFPTPIEEVYHIYREMKNKKERGILEKNKYEGYNNVQSNDIQL